MNLTKKEQEDKVNMQEDNKGLDGLGQTVNETIKKVEKTAADISEQLSKEFTKAEDNISNSIKGVFREHQVNQASQDFQGQQGQQGQAINLNKDNQEKQDTSFERFRTKVENKYNEMNRNGKTVTPDKLLLEPVLAVIASLLICGLGQMVNGQINKGLLMLAINVAQAVLLSCCCGLGVITGFIGCILIAIDAYNCAYALKQGESLNEYEIRLK